VIVNLQAEMIYLVHHGDAVLPDVDPMRPLSARGRAAVAGLAMEAARRNVRPDSIWHSGKLRARQTAEEFWRACNPLATFTAERGLQPADPPEWMRGRFIGETRTLMAVGHMPNLARLLRVMLGEDPDASRVSFPLHGMVALRADGNLWLEEWRLSP
jgi:phosphohistidine phosphatase